MAGQDNAGLPVPIDINNNSTLPLPTHPFLTTIIHMTEVTNDSTELLEQMTPLRGTVASQIKYSP